MAETARAAYRVSHPDVEAKLFILGEVTSFSNDKAKWEAVRLMQENGIGIKDIKSLAVQKDESPTRTEVRLWF